jgi:hypothetical protein
MTSDATVRPIEPAASRPLLFKDAAVSGGLSGFGRLFFRYRNPWIIVGALSLAAGLRIALGGWRALDLVVAAAFCLAQPFTEWLLHVFVLHFRPRLLAGRRIDLFVARKHRAHHQDPGDIGLTFVQFPALVGLIVVIALGTLAAYRDVRLALAAMVAAYALLLVYEWTHFLIHSTYVPRHWLYRQIWRSHRLHHFKNEHYWFGVTNPIGDLLLRTYPDKSAVPASPTARTLGVAVDS